MKSKDVQTVVKNKYENGDGLVKVFQDLGGVVSLPTINLWIKIMRNTGSINVPHSPSRPRTARTKAKISKMKQHLAQKKRVPTGRLAAEMNCYRSSFFIPYSFIPLFLNTKSPLLYTISAP
jgi:transposase